MGTSAGILGVVGGSFGGGLGAMTGLVVAHICDAAAEEATTLASTAQYGACADEAMEVGTMGGVASGGAAGIIAGTQRRKARLQKP